MGPYAAALLLLAACLVGAEDAPAWYTDRPVEDGILFGLGSAPQAAQSQDLAKADIAGQLMSSIDTKRESQKSQVTQDDAAGGSRREQSSSFSQTTTVSARARFLPGVEVVKQEQVGGRVYTLLKLDKEAFRQAATNRVNQIDTLLNKLAKPVPKLTGARLAALRRALAQSEERETLALTLGGQGIEITASALDPAAIRAQLGLLVTPGTIFFSGGQQATAVRDAAVASLAELDLASLEQADGARFELRLLEKSQQLPLPNTWIKVQMTGTITVINLETGETIGSLSSSVTSTNVSQVAAQSKAREQLITQLGAEIAAKLLPILIRGSAE
jgi:hypothetical protein